jgi:uncharacterized membrane protein
MWKLRLLFTFIYLIVDIIYVGISKGVYDNATKMIQGRPMSARIPAALAAYACMALGWYVFAAQTAERWSLQMNPILAGFLAGLVYGLLVIGTFNLTLNAMFDKWSGNIMIRDMIWGIGWGTTVTIIYIIFAK